MTNRLPAVAFKRRVLGTTPEFDQMRDFVEGSKNPDAVKLYYMARPCKGNGQILDYERLKSFVAKSSLGAEYERWMEKIIKFLNI